MAENFSISNVTNIIKKSIGYEKGRIRMRPKINTCGWFRGIADKIDKL